MPTEHEGVLRLSLDIPAHHADLVERVHYFGRHLDFDDRGEAEECGWHGFSQGRTWRNHLGTADHAPFEIEWDTELVPDQNRPVLVSAQVDLRNGLKYSTEPASVDIGFRSHSVQLLKCTNLPVPFWSRASQQRETTLNVSVDIKALEKAVLCVKIWDGGEGNVAAPFQINGHSYSITSGKAIHDVVYTEVPVDLAHLKQGANLITLCSDTEHHGIEVLLPGPCLKIKSKRA
jgi:hypothetical protein